MVKSAAKSVAKHAAAKKAGKKKVAKKAAPKEPTYQSIMAEQRRKEMAENTHGLHFFCVANYDRFSNMLWRQRRNAVAKAAVKDMNPEHKEAIQEAGKAAVKAAEEAGQIPKPTHDEIMALCAAQYKSHDCCDADLDRDKQITDTITGWSVDKDKSLPLSKYIVQKRKKRKEKEPNRAQAAYMYYMQANRERVKAENPDASFGELSKVVGAEWNALPEEARAPFVALQNKDRERYEAQIAEYRAGVVKAHKEKEALAHTA